ncbi:MAG TPA: hypothetical protein VEO95_06730 [Chthoniobacteraceae bacterium]|nr:hypothetical protein [Chthoniobacteraceae bacterium]
MNSRHRSHLQRPEPISSLLPLTGILKRSVTDRLAREFGEQLPRSLFRRALDEAESAAHSTGFPNLFFPALAEEKVRLVSAAIAPESAHRSWFCHAA